jgi:hypothetical protein
VSLNEVRIHEILLNALNDRFLERVIPMDGPSLIVPVCLRCGPNGRSFLRHDLMSFCLSMDGQKKVCRCEVHEIPKDGRLIVLDDLNGRSFLHHGQMSFCLSMVGRKMVGQFLEREIPKDGLNEKLAYARLLNLIRVSQNYGRYKRVCLTSSFSPGGRRLVLRCEVYLTTRALEHGHQTLGHRRSFWCRALRGHPHCDEACDLLQF